MLNDAAIWKNLNSPRRLFLIAGPCVIENEKLCLQVAASLKKTCAALGIFYVFKASFDKANRTSAKSFRGPGLDEGLRVLAKVRAEFGVPVLTDIHNESHAAVVGEVVDILQIPAFLCRQTDLIEAAAATGQIVNLKKGQFLSPAEMGQVAEKARRAGRGKNPAHRARHDVRLQQSRRRHALDSDHETFRLPGDFRRDAFGAIARRRRRQIGRPARICAGAGARALAAGANGLFIETHPRPDRALSDGPNMIPLAEMPALLRGLLKIFNAVKK